MHKLAVWVDICRAVHWAALYVWCDRMRRSGRIQLALPLVARDWPAISTSRLAPVSDRLNFEELFHAAELGDTVACEIRDRCLNVWSVAAIAMVHAYDPEILVMGGGVLKREATIVPFVQK